MSAGEWTVYGSSVAAGQWQPLQEFYGRGGSAGPPGLRYPAPHPAAYGSYTQHPTVSTVWERCGENTERERERERERKRER